MNSFFFVFLICLNNIRPDALLLMFGGAMHEANRLSMNERVK